MNHDKWGRQHQQHRVRPLWAHAPIPASKYKQGLISNCRLIFMELTIFLRNVLMAFFNDLPRSASSKILQKTYKVQKRKPEITSRPE